MIFKLWISYFWFINISLTIFGIMHIWFSIIELWIDVWDTVRTKGSREEVWTSSLNIVNWPSSCCLHFWMLSICLFVCLFVVFDCLSVRLSWVVCCLELSVVLSCLELSVSCQKPKRKKGKTFRKTLNPILRRGDRNHPEASWSGGAKITTRSQTLGRTKRRRGITLWCTGSPRAPPTLQDAKCQEAQCVV